MPKNAVLRVFIQRRVTKTHPWRRFWMMCIFTLRRRPHLCCVGCPTTRSLDTLRAQAIRNPIVSSLLRYDEGRTRGILGIECRVSPPQKRVTGRPLLRVSPPPSR
jgi:hypothetical protein